MITFILRIVCLIAMVLCLLLITVYRDEFNKPIQEISPDAEWLQNIANEIQAITYTRVLTVFIVILGVYLFVTT